MKNPIPHSNIFATPSLEQITKQIDGYPPKERAQLYMVFQFTLNACHKLVQDEILDTELAE